MAMHSNGMAWLGSVLIAWLALSVLSTAYVAWDAFTKNPERAVMKWGWVLVTLYVGPVAAALYVLSSKEPRPGAYEAFVKPRWKQALGSTIHCVAGDAAGVIAAAAVTGKLGLPMSLRLLVEYGFGFGFGLFVFQALFMRDMFGGSYATALRRSVLPELLSLNVMMAGMIPTMVFLMKRDVAVMNPTSLRFWGAMSLATLVGAVAAYPMNWWLVAAGLKHGMGAARPAASREPTREHGDDDAGVVSAHVGTANENGRAHGPAADALLAATRPQLVAMSVLSLVALAAGVLFAALGR